MSSFFINLPYNSGPQTFPNNTATTFDTKFNLARQPDREWSVALVAMSHPAKINNMVNGFYDVKTYSPNASYYWTKLRRVHLRDGCYTNSSDIWAGKIRAIAQQHPNDGYPGIPFFFYKKHSRIVVSASTMVRFNDGIGKAIGHFGPIVMLSGRRTMPSVVKPIDTITDILHVQASIIASKQIFGDTISPLLRLAMYTKVQDEHTETIYHEFDNLHCISVSAKTLDTLQIKITDKWGESMKFQDGKVVLTLHFKLKS